MTTYRESSKRSSYTFSMSGGGLSSDNGHDDWIYDNLLRITTTSAPRNTILPKPRMNFPLRAPIPGAMVEDDVVLLVEAAEKSSKDKESREREVVDGCVIAVGNEEGLRASRGVWVGQCSACNAVLPFDSRLMALDLRLNLTKPYTSKAVQAFKLKGRAYFKY